MKQNAIACLQNKTELIFLVIFSFLCGNVETELAQTLKIADTFMREGPQRFSCEKKYSNK